MTSATQKTQGNENKGNENKGSGDKEGVREDKGKGKGYYPVSDLQFDVMMIITEKCKALQAYDKYLLDAQPHEEIRAIIENIKKADREHVEQLQKFVGNC